MELPLPLTRRRALAGAFVFLALLVLGGRQLAGSGAAVGVEEQFEAVAAASTEQEAPRLLVHVVGAVQQPGLFELPEGSRVADALARAGGVTPRADLERVNLASPVADGTQIVVPRKQAPGAAPAAPGSPGGGPVHLNSATAAELESLPGVGPVTAQKIVAHREKHGAFGSVDELEAIPGIGPKRIDQIRDLVAP